MKTTFLSLLILFSQYSFSKKDFSKVKITTTKLSERVYLFEGAGGNMGLLTGNDGNFLIDDQFAPLTPKIKKAINKISSKPVRFVFNTHWHFDHTGGNENFGKMGSTIIAHENVRKLLSTDQVLKVFDKKVPAASKQALPVITFDSEINFYLNKEVINIFHVKNAHTNGDSIIHFSTSNIFHMGDTFFNGRFPFIDTEHGGSLQGVINAASMVIAKADTKTKIVPGHGSLASKSDLIEYKNTLQECLKILKNHKKLGHSLKTTLSKNPLQKFHNDWSSDFISTDKFITIVYPTI